MHTADMDDQRRNRHDRSMMVLLVDIADRFEECRFYWARQSPRFGGSAQILKQRERRLFILNDAKVVIDKQQAGPRALVYGVR